MGKKGIVHPHLLLVLSLLGVMVYFLFASTLPLKNQFLNLLFPKSASFAASASDWNQVQKDPQRTGFAPEILGTNFQIKWRHAFQPEKVHPQTQAIIYDDGNLKKVFVGTEMGNMYAFDAVNGQTLNPSQGREVWKYVVGSPILNSVAADNGLVFFGALDGAVYALNTNNGTLAWKQQVSRKGFSTAPIIADSKVMLGSRDGIFYAFDFSGNKLWEYNAGSPILQTAAWNSGKAYFGTLDMYVHGVNTLDGSMAWRSAQLYGGGFKEYWPVVHQGKVIIRAAAREAWREDRSFPGVSFPFATAWDPADQMWNWLNTNNAQLTSGNAIQIPEILNSQQTAMNNYAANPQNYIKNLYVLNETDGQESVVVPHWANNTMNGTTAPPCVDRDGYLVMSVLFVRSAWGRLNLQYGGSGTTPRMVDLLYDGFDKYGQPFTGFAQTPAGMGNPDENMSVTCSQNLIFSMHVQEMNAHYTGAFNLDTRRWNPMGEGTTNRQMWSNTQGGGTNPLSISSGMIYHISGYELIARTTN